MYNYSKNTTISYGMYFQGAFLVEFSYRELFGLASINSLRISNWNLRK